MRVLQVLSTLNIGSGITNCIINYYRNIDRDKVQFDFLVFYKAEKNYHEEVEKMGGRIFTIPAPTIKTFSRYNKQVQAFFNEHKNEWGCVHIHEILVQKFIIKHARKNDVKKICMHSHASKFALEDPSLSLVKRKLQVTLKTIRNKILLSGFKKKTDYHLACSNLAGIALYGKKGITTSKYFMLKNATNLSAIQGALKNREKLREKFNVSDKKVLLNIGRFCEQKNQAFLLKIFEKLHEKDDTYVLFLVGEGNDKKHYEEQYASLVSDYSLQFLGNRSDIVDILALSDMFVLPSIMEGLPVSLIEAQSSGLPCLVSSTVSKESCVTQAVKYLDLSLGVDRWAEEILNTPLIRYDTQADIIKSGYDIKTSALSLQELYLK